jgi:glucosyl-dolichyl phosphate glucuronosyltransferase
VISSKLITVVVSTLNRSEQLARCLAALQEQTAPAADVEVLIVDNGSTDDTPSVASRFCAQTTNCFYFRESQSGLAKARNAGIARSSSEIIAFTDDDALPQRDWAERLIKRFDEMPDDVAVIGGEVRPIWESERPDWLTDALLRPLSAGLMWSLEARFLRSDEWLLEVNSAYRKRLLQEFGGFPEHLGRVGEFLLSGENCVNRVMQRAGLRLFYDPGILVHHCIPASRLTRAWFRRRMFWQGVTMNLLKRFVEAQSLALSITDPSADKNEEWEEIAVPTSVHAWAELFNDKSSKTFEEHLDMIENLGYLLESQSLVIGR